jgi:hypothetical protein
VSDVPVPIHFFTIFFIVFSGWTRPAPSIAGQNKKAAGQASRVRTSGIAS